MKTVPDKEPAPAPPLVSVGVLTYNHEEYIAQALDSILMQETDFPVEIVVGEDCSQDGTRDIVRKYAAQYPDRIRALLHEENLGVNGNACAVRAACSGKYLAMLDGDNYWTCPHKLQKQVSFLEEHPEFIGSAHKVRVVDRFGELSQETYYAMHCDDAVYTLHHAEIGMLPGQMGTWVFRNVFRDFTPEQHRLYKECASVGDSKMALMLSLYGDFYCHREVMSAFRLITDGKSFSSRSYTENLSLSYIHWAEERERLAKEAFGRDVDFTIVKQDAAYHAFVALAKHPSINNAKIFAEAMRLQSDKARAWQRIMTQGLHVFSRRRRNERLSLSAR